MAFAWQNVMFFLYINFESNYIVHESFEIFYLNKKKTKSWLSGGDKTEQKLCYYYWLKKTKATKLVVSKS